MKIVAVLQARCSSNRLPGKVLKPLLGKSMLYRQIERIQRCKKIDQLVLATSVESSDDPLVDIASDAGIPLFRGSLNDVLDRFYGASKKYGGDVIVRLTGDCPLADHEVIDSCIEYFTNNSFDYVSNVLPPSFPDGLDVEVMSFDALEKAWGASGNQQDREHVTRYLYSNPEDFRIGNYWQDPDRSHMRWTVDNPEDFEFVEKVYKRLFPQNPAFLSREIFELIEKDSSLGEINRHIIRNEGSNEQ